jgi:hypothetical protein
MLNLVHRMFRSPQSSSPNSARTPALSDRLRTAARSVAACAILSSLSPWAAAQSGIVFWGFNQGPVNAPPPPAGTSYVEFSRGGTHTLFRLSNGEVIASGNNTWGQCNVPSLPPGLTYVEVAAGGHHSMARRSDGQVLAWGESDDGECDVPPLPPGVSYVEIAGGDNHSVARRSDGQVLAWGDNTNGQLNVPALPAGLTYVEVDANPDAGGHTVVRRSDGQVFAFGNNIFGQCNVPPLPPGVKYTGVAAGRVHTLARRSDGQIVGWGLNDEGECTPPALPAGVVYVDVDAGGWHSLARRSDKQVVAFGSNDYGECDVPPPPPGTTYVELESVAALSAARYEPSCPEPVVYCTAKTNSLGCSPSISMTGFANASSGIGCTVSTANVVGQKVGVYLHSTSGGAAVPLHGGTLCVQAPFKRHPATSTGGTAGLCDGVLSEDINTYIASGADPALVAGATFWIQAWSRDPADPFGDSLSNALSAVICP